MKPLGITARDIAAALPQKVHPHGPVLGASYWETKIKVLIGEEEEVGLGDGPDVLLFAALDRYFGLSEGYFLRCWVAAASRQVSWNHKAFLKKIKPLKRGPDGALVPLQSVLESGKSQVTPKELQQSKRPRTARKRAIVPSYEELMRRRQSGSTKEDLDEIRGEGSPSSKEPGVSLDGDLGYL